MAVITGNIKGELKIDRWSALIATSGRLLSHPTKEGRATDSCFNLIGAHQCGN